MMRVLGIETASPSGGVALMDEQRLLAVQTIFSSRAHSRLLLPAIETMLAELKLTVGDIDAVAVSRGPGSFTGVRVGMAVAKALCEPGRPRLVLVSTLEALAWRSWGGEAVDGVLPLLNARQGEVYGAYFPIVDGQPGPCEGGEFLLKPAEVVSRMAGRCLVAGEGARAFPEIWQAAGGRLVAARADRFHPGPEQVALLGLRAAQQGKFTDAAEALPMYLRDASTSPPRPR